VVYCATIKLNLDIVDRQ